MVILRNKPRFNVNDANDKIWSVKRGNCALRAFYLDVFSLELAPQLILYTYDQLSPIESAIIYVFNSFSASFSASTAVPFTSFARSFNAASVEPLWLRW